MIMTVRFSDDEVRRYARQMALPEVGGRGQEKLRAARLTAASELEALYLRRAGVGEVGLEAREGVTPLESARAAAEQLWRVLA